MAYSNGAFSFVGRPGGSSGIFQLRQSEVSDAVSLSSSKQSSIPELTRAEELAIKRSSSTFAPIGQRPSDDLMRDYDRASGTRRTSELDDDGIKVSQQSLNSPIDVIPSHVRGSTPDRVVSSGRIFLNTSNGERKPFDAGHLQENADHKHNPILGKSMRQQIVDQRAVEEPSTSAAHFDFEMRGALDEKDEPIFGKFDFKPEKNRHFVPKCLLLVLAVMIALAVVVAVSVQFRDNSDASGKRGNVLPDNITHRECQTRTFNLGDKLNFTCIFDATHEYRHGIENSRSVHVTPTNRLSTDNYTMKVIKGNRTSRHEILVNSSATARCSSAGIYDVKFLDDNGNVIVHVQVLFNINASTMTTSMQQRQFTGHSCLETVFDVTCNIHNDCNNYHTTLYKYKFGTVQELNSYLKCNRNFTDESGYSVDCSASLPETLVESYTFIACKAEAKLSDDKVVRKEQRFTLPRCGVESRCHTREPGYAVFNCSEKAKDYQNLQNAVCSFPKLSNCLTPGRRVFKIYKDNFDKLTCSKTNTVPVCRLSWCIDYRFIRKNEIPGAVICSPSYNEPYVSPTTTTSTVRTREETSPITSF